MFKWRMDVAKLIWHCRGSWNSSSVLRQLITKVSYYWHDSTRDVPPTIESREAALEDSTSLSAIFGFVPGAPRYGLGFALCPWRSGSFSRSNRWIVHLVDLIKVHKYGLIWD